MYQDDMTDDMQKEKWLPPEGWVDVEVVSMVEGMSKTNNPKFTINFASAADGSKGLQQDLTYIQGKRWLLWQLMEACGIEGEKTADKRTVYNWDISMVEGQSVAALVQHEDNNWIDREGNERKDKRAKFVSFRKMKVT